MPPLLKCHGCCIVPAISAPLLPSAVWQVIDAVAQAISRTLGCVLLDVDAGSSTNRTVYTFVGSPEAVVEGALSAARVAGQLIDMRQHSGEPGRGPGVGLAQRGLTYCWNHAWHWNRDCGHRARPKRV